MNAYYNDFKANSNVTTAPRRSRMRSVTDTVGRLLTLIDRLLAHLSAAHVAVIARVIVTTLCFFGFIGVVGGLEADKLSWPMGFAIVTTLAVVECVCLRKIKK